MNKLVERLRAEVLLPLVATTRPDQFVELLREKLSQFRRLWDALGEVVVATGIQITPSQMSRFAEDQGRALVADARAICGQEGEDDAHFAVSTAGSAKRLAATLGLLPESSESTRTDAELAMLFRNWMYVFELGGLLLGESRQVGESAAVAAAGSIALSRLAALGAYGAVRQAIDLRAPEEPTQETYLDRV